MAVEIDCPHSKSHSPSVTSGLYAQDENPSSTIWCDEGEDSKEEYHESQANKKGDIPLCSKKIEIDSDDLRLSFDFVHNEVLNAYKENHLAHIRLPEYSTLINFHHKSQPISVFLPSINAS